MPNTVDMLDGKPARLLRAAFTLGALALAAVALSACSQGPQREPAEVLPQAQMTASNFGQACVPAVAAQMDRAAALEHIRGLGFVVTDDTRDQVDDFIEGDGWDGEIKLYRPGALGWVTLDPGYTGALVPIHAKPQDMTCTVETILVASGRMNLSPAALTAGVLTMVAQHDEADLAVAETFGGAVKERDRFGEGRHAEIQYTRHQRGARWVDIITPKIQSPGGAWVMIARTRDR